MARKLNLVTPDSGTPDATRPDGFYLDEGGADPGTPILADEKTSIYYHFSRLMLETNKTFSGVADNIVISQFFDAFMQLVSGLDPAVAEWAAATFNVNDVTRYRGLQWFCGVASTINTPGPNSEWIASPTFREAMFWATSKGPLPGGFSPLNNIRDVTNYAVYYKIAKYDWYDAKWEAWWLNIDGSSHTSGTSDVAKLLALSKYAAEVTASEGGGFIVLKDYLGKISRAVDAVAGFTQNVGDEQEDQFQGHLHTNPPGGQFIIGGGAGVPSGAGANQAVSDTGVPSTDGVNGTPRTGEKTRDRSYAEGATGIVIIVPEGTI